MGVTVVAVEWADARLSSGLSQASGLVAVLAMFGLRSVPVRWMESGDSHSSAVRCWPGLVDFGATEGLAGSSLCSSWVGALGLALTLASVRRSVFVDVDAEPGADASMVMPPASPPSQTATARRAHSRIHRYFFTRAMAVVADTRGRIPLAIATASVCLVAGAALLIGPPASNWFQREPGERLGRSG